MSKLTSDEITFISNELYSLGLIVNNKQGFIILSDILDKVDNLNEQEEGTSKTGLLSETFLMSKGFFIRNAVSNLAASVFNKESNLENKVLTKRAEEIIDIAEALWEEIEAREQIDKVKELL